MPMVKGFFMGKEQSKKYAKIPTNGYEFEKYFAMLFRDMGYKVMTTPKSGDFGADIIL